VGVSTVGRYYDPATSQFLSVDPLVDVTQQPYGYANENPANESDPSGLWSCKGPVTGPGLTQTAADAEVLKDCGPGYNNSFPYNRTTPWYDIRSLTYHSGTQCVTASGTGPIPTNVSAYTNAPGPAYSVSYFGGPTSQPPGYNLVPPGPLGFFGVLSIASRANDCVGAPNDPSGQLLAQCANPNYP